MEIQNLLKDISKRSGNAGTNQTLKEACEVALVHLSSPAGATTYTYPYSEVFKAFCLATQSRVERVMLMGLDGLNHLIATASIVSLLEVCFVLSWEGADASDGGGNNKSKTQNNNSNNPNVLAGVDDGCGADAGSSSFLSADFQLPTHLGKAFHFVLTHRPLTETSSHLKAIQLLLAASSKSLQLMPSGDTLLHKVYEPLLNLHAAQHTSAILARCSYQLLSLVVTELTLGRFLADATPLDWEFFEPFTCAAATINPLEECAPDDLYEPIHIPARCRPFFSDLVGGFTLREASNMTINFPPSYTAFKDMVLVLCRRAAASVPTGLSEEAKAVAIAGRGTALKLLIDLFTAMPIANANEEHGCASWLALALEPHQLLPCICKNLATRTFFEDAIHLFALIALKVHFHMGVELHGFLNNVLIPLGLSQLSSYEHKVAIVRCLRNAFLAHPRSLISVFINYDCSLDFIDKRRNVPMGFLSSVIPFLTTLMFTQYSLVSPDQSLLLRQECVESVSVFIRSLLAWAAEEQPEGDGREQLDPKMAPLAYHWKHIHHLMHNKQLLQESRAVNMDGGMKKWLTFATDHGFFTSLHPAVIAKFLHHDVPQVVGDEVKHSLANALLKSTLHEDIMAELLALRSLRGQPLDIAFRDFVCDVLHPEGMPQDKQLPESQAWGRLQTLFGKEYAKQNADAEVKLTPYAADALAGSILFLHSATHNANSVMKFTSSDWIELTVESMGMPVARSYLEPIYLRTVAAPWGTLQTMMAGAAAVGGSGSSGSSSGSRSGGGATKGAGSAGGGGAGSGQQGSKGIVRVGLSYVNDDLSDTDSSSNKTKIDILYATKAKELCTEYNTWLVRLNYNFYRQPYIVPFYAMHVRPILLNYLPNVVVCLHLGTLSLTQMPILTTISECFENIHELSGALALNLRDLRDPAKELADSLFARPNAVPPEPFTLATMPLLCVDL